jgi:phage virion morphogenesis protein
MADDPLAPVDRWLTAALAALEPAARKSLLLDIARALRQRNQRRMGRQVGPDGDRWPARKRNSHGKVRSMAKMMLGLRQARRLTVKADANGAAVGYAGRNARIAQVHQIGGVDAVESGGPKVKYPARPLLGFSAEDVAFVRKRIMAVLEHD